MNLDFRWGKRMLIRLGYDIQFEIPLPVAMIAVLHVHPSRAQDLREPEDLVIEPEVVADGYLDSYGNRCTRRPLIRSSARRGALLTLSPAPACKHPGRVAQVSRPPANSALT